MSEKIVSMAQHRQLHSNRSVLDDRVAAEIMTSRVLTVSEDWSLEQLSDFFNDQKLSGAPVIGNDGRLAGVVSLSDIIRGHSNHDFYRPEEKLDTQPQRRNANSKPASDLRVGDIMKTELHDVTMNTPLHKVAAIMVKETVHRVLVTHDKKVVGIISSLDLLRQEVS
ncbi:CBS domain-containing protein [Aestuariirhabdus sp. Z084]|uniref:CBS domain-containing protein n=1 Tax=Aestuariirhabdus haliotis TaxID=2918751 RepID=UPI00201B3AE6|nr:CBS domain-containing protein [Aestuariirhabdus haliotis]MCL6417411.1 CBS domain-containing protein [Aestuariirhabdus haliotis]MCL6421355.1 CBS domain-containing protein [Aestuariirhabdus haliotis]